MASLQLLDQLKTGRSVESRPQHQNAKLVAGVDELEERIVAWPGRITRRRPATEKS